MSNINGEVALALALDGRASVLDRETTSLLAVAGALRALPDPVIDPVFASALEQRLMTEGLEQAPAGRPSLRLVEPATPIEDDRVIDVVVSLPRRRVAMRRSVVALAAAMTLSAFPVLAASSALPGSPFYGIKQGIHAAQIAFFGDAFADADRRLGFAAEHIGEAEQLVALGSDNALVSRALDLAAYEIGRAEQTVRGTDDAKRLASFAAKAAETEALLQKSAPVLAPEAQDAFDRAMDASRSLTEAVADGLQGPKAGLFATLSAEIADATAPAAPATVSPSAPAANSSTTTAESTKTTKTDESGNGSTAPKDGDDSPGGKAVNGAKSYGCSVPGQYEIGLIFGSAQHTCAAIDLG